MTPRKEPERVELYVVQYFQFDEWRGFISCASRKDAEMEMEVRNSEQRRSDRPQLKYRIVRIEGTVVE